MPRKPAAKNRRIAIFLRKDAELDGRPSLKIGQHPEFADPQAEALQIGQQLRCRRQRIGGDRPVDDARIMAGCDGHGRFSSAANPIGGLAGVFPDFLCKTDESQMNHLNLTSFSMKSSARTRTRTKADLDLTDRKILSILRTEGRLTVNELAGRVGLSPSPCWSRVKRLEEVGAIKHYSAIIDHTAIGLKDIVFIEVTLDKHDDKVLVRFGEALAKIPEVIEANLVTGEYDYLVKVAVADTTHYERFLREKLYRIQGIRHTRSTFSLRTLKLITSADPLLVREQD
jgi:Lrp/AsnC family transcriptional regulator, leucine-responsive regulatory protein